MIAVGQLAAHHATQFGSAEWEYMAGVWHDIDKYRRGFKRYILQANDPDAHIEGRVARREKAHSATNALWAQQDFPQRYGTLK